MSSTRLSQVHQPQWATAQRKGAGSGDLVATEAEVGQMGVLPRAGQDDRRAGMIQALLAGADDQGGAAGLRQGQQRPAVAGRA